MVAKFLEKQAALAAAVKFEIPTNLAASKEGSRLLLPTSNSSSTSSGHAPGRQSRDPAPGSTAQGRSNGTLETGHAAGPDAAGVRPPAASGGAAVEGAGASAVRRQAAAADPAACADAAPQPTAADAAAPGRPQVMAADTQGAAAQAMSEPQQPHAGLSLQGKRCLDLSAGCGLVGEQPTCSLTPAAGRACLMATMLPPGSRSQLPAQSVRSRRRHGQLSVPGGQPAVARGPQASSWRCWVGA